MRLDNTYRTATEAGIREHLETDKVIKITVISNSMSPILKKGDILSIVKIEQKDLKIGDIIFFVYFKKFVVHRLLNKAWAYNRKVFLRCKGDGSRVFDRLICSEKLIGLVVARERKGKQISFRSKTWLVLNPILAFMSDLHGIGCKYLRKIKRKHINAKISSDYHG